ncbi:phosphoenolpyruvate synthase [Paenibacillus kribbensis]|uniref:Phosphoenolpyruvate synthase n=1 Tax=Paenibacillus kribbensis TaxID=172713 RepID=A0A222WIQ0_9BACL|nr:PEP/pyruvate-binding domain-containing protein [Paenibacillus kribbensis]ASR46309.1 phosphoenolpyruvate synthase [Paenibacillus kribbensis]
MGNEIKWFAEITPELQKWAGGKGGMLARMLQAGYPIPDGFIVFPQAFKGERLEKKTWKEIIRYLEKLRKDHPNASFAVRSSALSEDSAVASFAGEFESVLEVETNDDVLKALDVVHYSQYSERVQAYSAVKGIEEAHQMAVVVQIMVPSEISGVLFTVEPITGNRSAMSGNLVFGLGEQLVSGEGNAHAFSLFKPSGRYEGPKELLPYVRKLYRYASRLEKEMGEPQDIEWGIANGKLFFLQARPVTTLSPGNMDTFEWNDSLTGDFLWTNTNVGESISDVVTPLSWSIIRALDEEHNVIPGHYLMSGNICGRVYSNVSVSLSAFLAFGWNKKSLLKKMSNVFGEIPDEIQIPVYPFSKKELIKIMLPKMLYAFKQSRKAMKLIPQHIKKTAAWCIQTEELIRNTQSKDELIALWNEQLWFKNIEAMWIALEGPSSKMQNFVRWKEKLEKWIGRDDTSVLLSNLRGSKGLASLGPVVGISSVVKGEMSQEDYLLEYGHRGPHEFELSMPDPRENPDWLEKQIKEAKKSGMSVDDLLYKQREQNEIVWTRLEQRFPYKIKKLKRIIAKISEGPHLREAVRSEWTRVFRLNRSFALKAGEFMGIGEDVFFLYIDEILNWLAGGSQDMECISIRRMNYLKYKQLPPLPSIIRGRFEPLKWLEDPNRRVDYYDPYIPLDISTNSEIIEGVAGAAGRIEGTVRVLRHPEDGHQLLPGEILVTSTTNVGWTPLFPKAAAIVTDIGAPLSHAAIVARELGIPAVVGCGNATTRMKTGDKVIVDGGQGIVQMR